MNSLLVLFAALFAAVAGQNPRSCANPPPGLACDDNEICVDRPRNGGGPVIQCHENPCLSLDNPCAANERCISEPQYCRGGGVCPQHRCVQTTACPHEFYWFCDLCIKSLGYGNHVNAAWVLHDQCEALMGTSSHCDGGPPAKINGVRRRGANCKANAACDGIMNRNTGLDCTFPP